jgi:CRISPR-associated protein Cas2
MAKKTSLHYLEVLKKLRSSGLTGSPVINRLAVRADTMPTLQERIDALFGIIHNTNRLGGKMLFFIMYDIESNKVRYNIVKYLERMGCYRIQKSIFLANLSMEKYERIKRDMVEVQSLYENHDSIIVCPVSSDILRSMKIIGQNINLDLITQSKNTLFF